MPFRAHGPEPCASAYSATRAHPIGMGSRPRLQAPFSEAGVSRSFGGSPMVLLHCREPTGK
jgi:hypothetical protein